MLIVAAYFAATIVYFCAYVIFISATQSALGNDTDQIQRLLVEHIASLDGISGMYIMQFLILLPVIITLANFKTQTFQTTLAIKPVRGRVIVFWLGVLLIFIAAETLIETFIEIPVDQFLRLMSGSGHLGIAFVAVVLAPILEELIFRGYLFKTLRHSWLGFSGTLMATSLLFTLIHLGQYSAVIMWEMFIFSLILGVAREKTGSIYVPWFLHMMNNFIQVVAVVFLGII